MASLHQHLYYQMSPDEDEQELFAGWDAARINDLPTPPKQVLPNTSAKRARAGSEHPPSASHSTVTQPAVGTASNLASNPSILPRVSTDRSESRGKAAGGELKEAIGPVAGSADCESSSSASWTGDELYYRPRTTRHHHASPKHRNPTTTVATAAAAAIAASFAGLDIGGIRTCGNAFLHDLKRHDEALRVRAWLAALPDLLADPNVRGVHEDELPAPLSPFVETERGSMRRWRRKWESEDHRHGTRAAADADDEDIWPSRYV